MLRRLNVRVASALGATTAGLTAAAATAFTTIPTSSYSSHALASRPFHSAGGLLRPKLTSPLLPSYSSSSSVLSRTVSTPMLSSARAFHVSRYTGAPSLMRAATSSTAWSTATTAAATTAITPATESTTALVTPVRSAASLTPTTTLQMRAPGGDRSIRQQDVPMSWGGGGNQGGSQADSLTPYVRQHLARVYGLLLAGCAAAGMGSFLMIATPLSKVIPFWLPMFGGFVPLLWLSFAPPANPTTKLALFFSFTLLEGMAIAPLVLMTSMKGVLITSIVLTAAIFGGFSAAAYLSPRASLVAWQGPLFGALIGLVAVSVLNIFFPSAIAHSLILYGGLALFSVMVAVDTQAMIERARCGAGDHVQDALQMFLNVVNIFVRIAQIMGSMND